MQMLFGSIAAVILVGLFLWQLSNSRKKAAAAPFKLFEDAAQLLDGPVISSGEAAGVYELTGSFNGHAVQVKAITDTLATRKLPSLWLMVTIPEPLPLQATFDMMMRPAGPMTFSNFERLPEVIERPHGFPEHAVIRSDDPMRLPPLDIFKPHLGPFFTRSGKELLVTPKGARIVELLAEADRARYGVFRQADFGEIALSAPALRQSIQLLLNLRQDIEDWHKAQS